MDRVMTSEEWTDAVMLITCNYQNTGENWSHDSGYLLVTVEDSETLEHIDCAQVFVRHDGCAVALTDHFARICWREEQ
jgi:hypothetical protein